MVTSIKLLISLVNMWTRIRLISKYTCKNTFLEQLCIVLNSWQISRNLHQYYFSTLITYHEKKTRKFCFRNLAKITENPHIFAVFICQYWLMTFDVNQIGNFSSPAAWVKFMYMLGNGGDTSRFLFVSFIYTPRFQSS